MAAAVHKQAIQEPRQLARDLRGSNRTRPAAYHLWRMDASGWDWVRIVVDHIDVHASDYTESLRFYETVLAPLGIPRVSQSNEGTCFTNVNVVDRTPPTTNLHLCFHARSREQVDAFHAAGLAAGFRSNGTPGYRDYQPGYYAAYLLDPDGNNVEALYRDVGCAGHGIGDW
jgi:catechol 2,3-dioxygenase-like lactoylglutathione lyase family enzyme